MNEISNFCTGECKGDSYNGSHNNTNSRPNAQSSSQLDEFDPNNPPYSIQNQGSTTPLNVKTLDMDAVHHGGVLEYDAHNLFGKYNYIMLIHCREPPNKGHVHWDQLNFFFIKRFFSL